MPGDRLDPRGRAKERGDDPHGLCVLALYGGTALGLEDARRRDVLPLFRRGGATQAFEGFEAQLERLESEAGVRQQL